MNELIKINYETEQPTVSARELHKELAIEKRFSAWFETNSQGFVEGEDFTSVLTGTVVNNGAHRELQDYKLSVDMAKHICLMSRTEKGKQCRQYLIDIEKAWNTPELVMARGLKAAQQMIADQSKIIERMKPKEIFADAVATSKQSILIGQLAKLICQNGHEIGQQRLFRWMRDNGYLMIKKRRNLMKTQEMIEKINAHISDVIDGNYYHTLDELSLLINAQANLIEVNAKSSAITDSLEHLKQFHEL